MIVLTVAKQTAFPCRSTNMGPELQIRAKVFRNAKPFGSPKGFGVPRLFGMMTRATMLMLLMLALAAGLCAQPPANQNPPAASQNTLGVVTNIDAATSQLTLKTDAGQEVKVSMAPNASFRR